MDTLRPPLVSAAAFAALLLAHTASAQPREAPPGPRPRAADACPGWPGEEFPLPLAVKSADDLAFKAVAERHFLQFNLLAAGKLAWDAGDYRRAATQWEELLRTPALPDEIRTFLSPWATTARARVASPTAPLPATSAATPVPLASTPKAPPGSAGAAQSEGERGPSVSGVLTGGGPRGPAGAVVVLRKAQGPTPKPRPGKTFTIRQKDKRFLPHVLVVPQGSSVRFRNDDELFHNVFSLSRPNDFDLGLYASGGARDRAFQTAGPVEILCNIHSTMSAWVYVVDSIWHAQADARGRFDLGAVPEGSYELEVWHEWTKRPVRQPLRVEPGLRPLSIALAGDRLPPSFVPDKAGKPRQPQLGY